MGHIIGPRPDDVLEALSEDVDIAVPTTTTKYSRSFSLANALFFALSYIATSPGTVTLQIQLEQSWVLPTTEGSSDANWGVPEGMSDIDAVLSDETIHHISLSPVALPFGRLKIIGSGGNDAGTTLRARLSKQTET